MDLVLSPGQEQAMEMTARFFAQDEELVAVISGFAGTGKSTLIGVLASTYGIPVIVAPTGKAAIRVREVTQLPASTIHKSIYKAEEDLETGEPYFTLKEVYELRALFNYKKYFLVDEASMVDEKVWKDLQTVAEVTGVKIILMGDTFQLPPVTRLEGKKAFCALDYPTTYRVHLSEIVRQALDSPIIRASMLIRQGRPDYEAFALLNPVARGSLINIALIFADGSGAVLVHRNKTRHMINNGCREAEGMPPDTIEEGEPLLVTQNSYPLDRFNGEIITFGGWDSPPQERTRTAVLDRYTKVSLNMSFGVGNIDGRQALLSPQEVTGRAEEAKMGLKAIRKNAKRVYRDQMAAYGDEEDGPPYLHANYGYALTGHRSQGSQWQETLVVVEPSLKALGTVERRRWLYTTLTRAQEKVSYLYLDD